jgi:hypothetical protein
MYLFDRQGFHKSAMFTLSDGMTDIKRIPGNQPDATSGSFVHYAFQMWIEAILASLL